ncbi:bleomycin resistance protein [Prosthecobacter sp.]|uniref:bleomycin resistance protein n=1 Tax=Prosthecobacter sp. TaxID=1965333 RepID=UPI00378422F5
MNTPACQAKTLSPVIPVADMDRSIRFYHEVLGFHTSMQSADYSILTREGASLHLTMAADASVLEFTRKHLSCYLEIRGIEALWAHVSTFKDRHKVRDLFDREYGMREFHIIDPDGCLIFVGEPIQ